LNLKPLTIYHATSGSYFDRMCVCNGYLKSYGF